MSTNEDVIDVVNEYKELAFLRYFYDCAYDAMGPAVDDVYQMIKEQYEGELPEGY
jgi:hypothetical protein